MVPCTAWKFYLALVRRVLKQRIPATLHYLQHQFILPTLLFAAYAFLGLLARWYASFASGIAAAASIGKETINQIGRMVIHRMCKLWFEYYTLAAPGFWCGGGEEARTEFHAWIPLESCTAMASPKFRFGGFRKKLLIKDFENFWKIYKQNLHKNLKNLQKNFIK